MVDEADLVLDQTTDLDGKIAVLSVRSLKFLSGKPSAMKVARSVWSEGKAVKPYLSPQI
jgi:hypothetical protein